MDEGRRGRGRPRGSTRRERGRPSSSGQRQRQRSQRQSQTQTQRRSFSTLFPEAHGTTREERRRQRSTVIRLSKETVNSLQRIQRERHCESLDDVLDILIERSTSELESFNNKILSYASKRHAFQFPGYRARCLVAAMDYQENKVQEPLQTETGEYRLHRLYRKRSANWDVVYVKEKTFNYVGDLLDLAVQDRITNPKKYQEKILMSAYDPCNIATHSGRVSPPPTRELYEAKKSRFEKE